MVAVAVVALTMGQGQAKPKGALALIFGIVAAYLVLLFFFFQTRDVSRAEAKDLEAAAQPQGEIENPAVLDEAHLWAAMAIHPVDADAVKARKQVWATARGSIHTGMLVCVLIFVGVPPIYLLDTWVPFVVCAPLIGLIALFKSVRLLGGGLDEAYDASSRAMAPLGLRVVEHPEVRIQPKYVAPLRMGPVLHGQLAMEGERHGRKVSVHMPASAGVRTPCEVRVEVDSPGFEFKSRDGRLKAAEGAPPAVAEALASVPNSTRWNGVRGGAGGEGIVVTRKSSHTSDWLLDLWLAERLTGAIAR
jgi:hypothetical protein